jgi:hypothetical protein
MTTSNFGYENYSPHEIVRRGEAIYENELRDRVEPANHGRFLVLDLESHDFEIDDDDLTATTRLLDRHPSGVLYGLKIGHSAAYRIGASFGAGRP